MFFREPAYSSTAKPLDNALHKVTDAVCLLVKSEDDAGINALVKCNFVSGTETPVTEMPFRSGYAVASLRCELAFALLTCDNFHLPKPLNLLSLCYSTEWIKLHFMNTSDFA